LFIDYPEARLFYAEKYLDALDEYRKLLRGFPDIKGTKEELEKVEDAIMETSGFVFQMKYHPAAHEKIDPPQPLHCYGTGFDLFGIFFQLGILLWQIGLLQVILIIGAVAMLVYALFKFLF
jgi:hypothetical protein